MGSLLRMRIHLMMYSTTKCMAHDVADCEEILILMMWEGLNESGQPLWAIPVYI